MYIVRAIKEDDIDGFYALALKAGTGMLTLPKHKPTLAQRVQDSIKAFTSPETLSEKRDYLMVLEDTNTGQIVGSSAIIAGVGLDKPFYTYRTLHLTQYSKEPAKRTDTQLLQMSNDFIGAAELASLFLDPDHRKPGIGSLLSRARYLLMSAHPDRFSDRVIAEMRGWVDEDDVSPFWEAIGRHFFDMDYTTADKINAEGNFQFINDLMPKFPIYTALLPEDARRVMGEAHDGAKPARRLLEKEGFRYNGCVDIFDGGPTLEVNRRAIWTVRNSRSGLLGGTVEGSGQAATFLVANPSIEDFRVTLSNVVETESGYWLPEEAARSLNLKEGDSLRFAPLSHRVTG